MKNQKVAIEGKQLVRRFNEHTAVNHVSLKVFEGEFICLLGPSGCGKTTMLKMLAGLDFPDEGTIYLENKDVTNTPSYGRDSNMVFQQLALFPHLNVWQNVAYGLRVKGLKKDVIQQKVSDILKLVKLEQFKDRNVTELSGGQAQRVAIARALVNNPKVLFLDEPLSALDEKLRLEMQQELKRIQRESNSTFIFVTHDQNEAVALSDRIGVMKDGQLLQFGSIRELYEEPVNEFVATFIGDTNLLDAKVEKVIENYAEVTIEQQTIRVRLNKHIPTNAGDVIRLSVRNEYIQMTKELTDAEFHWDGIVTETRYGGTNIYYKVQIANGYEFNVTKFVRPGQTTFALNDQVKLSWNTDDSLIVLNESISID